MNYSNKPYELQDDNGNLFQNKKKGENSPDWSGKIKLNSQLFYLSAWEKKTKTGDVFFSVRLGKMVPAEPSQHSIDKGNGYAPGDRKDTLDEEIPF
jgi:hypothetical protein